MSALATDVVQACLMELHRRKGFDWWFEELDEEIQEKIVDAMEARVDQVLGSQ